MQEPRRSDSEGTHAGWDEEIDVLIVGLGCAGASAAIEAARQGASVLILERASFGGGTSALSGGVLYCGGGTSLQRACGFEDSVESMRDYLCASCGPDPDEQKIAAYCEASAEHFEWLVELGVPFKASFWPEYTEPSSDDGLYFSGCEHTQPFSSLTEPAPRGHVVRAQGSAGDTEGISAGRVLMDVLERSVRQAGADVALGSRLSELLLAPDGRVCGARYEREGLSHTVGVRRGIVLTTGGFIANKEMVRQHAPRPWALAPLAGAHDDGEGIRLGMAAGGAARHMDALAYMCPVLEPHTLVKGILFDERGQRFVTEDANHKRIAERALTQAGGRIYLLVDDASFCQPRFEKPLIAVAESIPEIEAALPFLPQESLERTVDRYNAAARAGLDTEWGKRAENLEPITHPPYGVFDCSLGEGQLYLAFTLGGLATRPTGEVLNRSGAPIRGLYAAGRATSGLSAQNCFASGIQLGEGTFFGRLAGRSAGRMAPTLVSAQEALSVRGNRPLESDDPTACASSTGPLDT